MTLLYIILAILGLGFLVFIHELGHYFMAKKVGMRIEAFGIGFGKPIYSWMRNGVRWSVGILPFGGYVKIAGMQKEKGLEPHEIPDGFFGKKPIDRIKVALMGPLVNIVFALFGFALIWTFGGRQKPLQEFSNRIGWVDPSSSLYQFGVRPGDEISEYDNRDFNGFKDLAYAAVIGDQTTRIKGYKIDYFQHERDPFDYTLHTYKDPRNEELHTIGALAPASYLIYDKWPGGIPNPIKPTSPMLNSGIDYKSRVIWVDGELIFSAIQLRSIVNQSVSFLTIERDGEILQTRVPRISIKEMNLNLAQKEEFEDWVFETNLSKNSDEVYFMPYFLDSRANILSSIPLIDEDFEEKIFRNCKRCLHYTPLMKNDRIIAINGTPVSSIFQLLEEMQTRKSLIIVEENVDLASDLSWKEVGQYFDKNLDFTSLKTLISKIGIDSQTNTTGQLKLLNPVTPKPFRDIYPERPAAASPQASELFLGLEFQDKEVNYNPNPLKQFKVVFNDTWFTLFGMISGQLHPKYISGPVGIVQVVHLGWSLGFKEALFWLSLISLNLAIINLLPLPVLDGGHIVFSCVEMVTKKPIKTKTMERLIIPFVVLLIALFIYITYNDISRIFSKFF